MWPGWWWVCGTGTAPTIPATLALPSPTLALWSYPHHPYHFDPALTILGTLAMPTLPLALWSYPHYPCHFSPALTTHGTLLLPSPCSHCSIQQFT
ncbi:hypothetical protein E2C01_001979 [Portunus trituberculatus]|uniref:Uncharacterized protein n=1 Tax=Portunus trituberculatus TaxID=210409 RepID=A0A5B7CIN5_PORTR|nr:hypothetical protein [Portunus trituberculatus]